MSYTLDLDSFARVSWYPGHMLKAQREITDRLSLIDVVIVVVDARIPFTSWNSKLHDRTANKQRIVILSKQDLAEPETTQKWLKWYRDQGVQVAAINCNAPSSRKKVLQLLKKASSARTGARARMRAACRAMVIGVPNVGKSSLINCLVEKRRAKTGPTPGVTRHQQWAPIGSDFEMLDTPGVMVPRIADGAAGLRLGLVAAIKDRICGEDILARYLFHCLIERNRLEDLADYYEVDELPDSGDALLDTLATQWGFLHGGGIPDRTKSANRVLQDYRSGKMAPMSLETPDSIVQED